MVIHQIINKNEKKYLEKLKYSPEIPELVEYLVKKYGAGEFYLSNYLNSEGKNQNLKINTMDYTNRKHFTSLNARERGGKTAVINTIQTKTKELSGENMDLGKIMESISPFVGALQGMNDKLGDILTILEEIRDNTANLEEIKDSLSEAELSGQTEPGQTGNIGIGDILGLVNGLKGQDGTFNLNDIVNAFKNKAN